MTLDKLKQMYDDREFKNYQEVVAQCLAIGVEQCLCYGHKFLRMDCTVEKCHAASLEKPCSPALCFERQDENPCVWCTRNESYCLNRNEDGTCVNDAV